jgi:hypothetical protein
VLHSAPARATSTSADVPPKPDQGTASTGSPSRLEDRQLVEKIVARGERHLSEGNAAVARQFFVRAAEAGVARAAQLLASTYDPYEFANLGIRGCSRTQPKPASGTSVLASSGRRRPLAAFSSLAPPNNKKPVTPIWTTTAAATSPYRRSQSGLNVELQCAELKIWSTWESAARTKYPPLFQGDATVRMARVVYGIAGPGMYQLDLFASPPG